jgi:hypothetical protein|tara:strand:- start:157 stop:432 length:276 start_codon:yes stop_codon:yes gene_type:complete
MIEFTRDNDEHVYKIEMKSQQFIFIDGFELLSYCSELEGVSDGDEPTPKDTADAVRAIAWDDDNRMDTYTDHELFSAGIKALIEVKKLGNV